MSEGTDKTASVKKLSVAPNIPYFPNDYDTVIGFEIKIKSRGAGKFVWVRQRSGSMAAFAGTSGAFASDSFVR